MIKNRELALIPDSALELLEPPATSPTPVPGPRPATGTRSREAPRFRRGARRTERPPR